tara:strand:+ start:1405 stop:1947 length:543 start_codon:yes stop_codon:yes gene_type:complete
MGLQAASPSHADSPLFVLRLQLLNQAGERVFYQEEDNRFEHDATLKLLRGELYTYELRLDDLVGSIDSISAVEIDGRILSIRHREETRDTRTGCRQLLVRVTWAADQTDSTRRGRRDVMLCALQYLNGSTLRQVNWCTQLKVYETRAQLEKKGRQLKAASCRFEHDKQVGRWSFVQVKAL